MPDKKQRPIVVLHIPKTAGTSLRRMIQDNYQANDLYFIYGKESGFTTIEDFKNLAEEEKSGVELFMGHLSFNLGLFPGLEPKFITLVRDPVDRVISYYHHVMNRHQEWRDKNMSLLKYIEISNDVQMNNNQTKMISGMHRQPVTEKHLQTAISNIENHFAYVGVSEEFNKSVDILCSLFNWEARTIYKENIAKNRPGRSYFSEYEINKIKELNRFDMRLYDYVKCRQSELAKGAASFRTIATS